MYFEIKSNYDIHCYLVSLFNSLVGLARCYPQEFLQSFQFLKFSAHIEISLLKNVAWHKQSKPNPGKPLANQEKPLESQKEKPLENQKEKPLENQKEKPLENQKEKPLENQKVKPLANQNFATKVTV